MRAHREGALHTKARLHLVFWATGDVLGVLPISSLRGEAYLATGRMSQLLTLALFVRVHWPRPQSSLRGTHGSHLFCCILSQSHMAALDAGRGADSIRTHSHRICWSCVVVIMIGRQVQI